VEHFIEVRVYNNNKDGIFCENLLNPAFAIRNHRQIFFPNNELENDLIISPYIEKIEAAKNENERRTQTPQIDLKALFHFPFNERTRTKDPHEEEKFLLRKRYKEEFNTSESRHNFKLYIHRVAIRQKVIQKKKLPMILQKELQSNLSEEKPKLVLTTIPKPSLDPKSNLLRWNKSLPPKNLNRPMWNAPIKKSKVTSNEIRFQYDKKNRQTLENNSLELKSHIFADAKPKPNNKHSPLIKPIEHTKPRSMPIPPEHYTVNKYMISSLLYCLGTIQN